MDIANWFRIITGIFFFSAVTISIYHRSKAERASGEKLDRREENKVLQTTLRLGGLLLWLTIFVYLINPAWMTWAFYPSPDWLRWLGVMVAGLGWLLIIWMFRNLGNNITDTVVTRREHQLVTRGPYRWIRHPLYATGVALFLAVGLMAANWFILLFAAMALAGIRRVVIPLEEQELLVKFGERYRTYMQRTGSLVPRLGRGHGG